MSYNTELQSNNTDLQAILDTVNALPEAGGSGGGNNSGEWILITSLPTTYALDPDAMSTTYYYEIPENCKAVVFRSDGSGTYAMSYRIYGSFDASGLGSVTWEDAFGDGSALKIVDGGSGPYTHILPIFFNAP